MKQQNIILKSFVGCLLAILLVSCSYYTYDKIFNYKTVITTEKWIGDGGTKTIPYGSKVICEKGIDIGIYSPIQDIWLYSCLHLNEFGCSGNGKTCLIETSKRVRK